MGFGLPGKRLRKMSAGWGGRPGLLLPLLAAMPHSRFPVCVLLPFDRIRHMHAARLDCTAPISARPLPPSPAALHAHLRTAALTPHVLVRRWRMALRSRETPLFTIVMMHSTVGDMSSAVRPARIRDSQAERMRDDGDTGRKRAPQRRDEIEP